MDNLCDKQESLSTFILDKIGQRAKVLNGDLDKILSYLEKLSRTGINNENKIDFLFDLLEASFENKHLLEQILQRLKAIERIHKESPNIETLIKNLIEKQKLIDLSFQHEDQQIAKTKNQLLDSLKVVQKDLMEVTALQKNL